MRIGTVEGLPRLWTPNVGIELGSELVGEAEVGEAEDGEAELEEADICLNDLNQEKK